MGHADFLLNKLVEIEFSNGDKKMVLIDHVVYYPNGGIMYFVEQGTERRYSTNLMISFRAARHG